MNEDSGKKVNLRENGNGSYILGVQFLGGEKTETTVDSGAEESVCPWEWGSQFGTSAAGVWMTFRDAQGGEIEHYGQGDVKVLSFCWQDSFP